MNPWAGPKGQCLKRDMAQKGGRGGGAGAQAQTSRAELGARIPRLWLTGGRRRCGRRGGGGRGGSLISSVLSAGQHLLSEDGGGGVGTGSEKRKCEHRQEKGGG